MFANVSIVVVTFVIGFVGGFCYFAYRIARNARPMTIELVERMVKLHQNEGLGTLLAGRRQMIAAAKHQIEAHGLVHRDDVLAWLEKMDRQFLHEQEREGERIGLKARRQLDEEEAQAKGSSE